MTSRILKMACLGVVSVACITMLTFAESPPPPGPYAPTGWYWTGDGVEYDPRTGVWNADWDDPDNWEWHGLLTPSWHYPQDPDDDVYFTWAGRTPLVVYLTTEEIDALSVHGNAEVFAQSWTFKSGTLSCDHITFKASNGPFYVTVAGMATIQTVD